ncbi:MAG: hypothetical protein ACR2OZ_06835 [Verrucomicrobiales bacterium]
MSIPFRIPHSAFLILRHPLWILAGGVLLTQSLKDGFYPFSHFAMYSRLDDEGAYTYLTDSNGQPLSTLDHAGLSAAKVNKLYHSALKNLCQRSHVRLTQARPELKAEAAGEVLKSLRAISLNGKYKSFPQSVRMVQVVIDLKDGKMHQVATVVGEG